MFAYLAAIENHLSEVIIAALAFMGVLISQWVIFCVSMRNEKRNSRVVEEINDAVNHRHLRADSSGNVPMKLYDLIWETHKKGDELIEWKRSYDHGPLDNGVKVHEFVQRVDKMHDTVEALVEQCKTYHCQDAKNVGSVAKATDDECNRTDS